MPNPLRRAKSLFRSNQPGRAIRTAVRQWPVAATLLDSRAERRLDGFHSRMRMIVILALGLLAAVVHCSPADQSARPDLNGRVFAEQGSPLKGASVFIYTAGPKVGVGTL